jgi:hypothetical protein
MPQAPTATQAGRSRLAHSTVTLRYRARYFYYNIEPIAQSGTFKGSGYGNYSPGPFRKLINDDLPWVYKLAPDTLYQVFSLPAQ